MVTLAKIILIIVDVDIRRTKPPGCQELQALSLLHSLVRHHSSSSIDIELHNGNTVIAYTF